MRPLEVSMKYCVFLQNDNAVTEWEMRDLSQKEAEKEAFEAARVLNDGEQIFVICDGGYLNQDGHSPVGKAWIAPKISKLEMTGITLFGSRWQTELSASLKNADGKPLDARRIRQWLAGDYATPEWVWHQIKLLAEQRKVEIVELITKL